MLILKGNTEKSVLVHEIMERSNSICFVYDTIQHMFEHLYIHNIKS